jgi:hypothetical protein
MDIISHGLYGGAGFAKKGKKVFWLAFLIGMMPDLMSFGIFWVDTLLGFHQRPNWQAGPPAMSAIPGYVGALYDFTHSLVIFSAVFLVVWAIRKKPFWLLIPWGLHVMIDIPSHSSAFFPTPFLWPISSYHFEGIGWGNPTIFVPNVIILIAIYSVIFWKKRKKFRNIN